MANDLLSNPVIEIKNKNMIIIKNEQNNTGGIFRDINNTEDFNFESPFIFEEGFTFIPNKLGQYTFSYSLYFVMSTSINKLSIKRDLI